ncbi:MAG: hypothetical protein U0175_29555 [Caldilineaceae bacterium]
MKPVSEAVETFFKAYEQGLASSDLEVIGSSYAESFLFAGPQGAQAVTREGFLKALPRRQGFFETVGLSSSKIQSLQETWLDEHYVSVKVGWVMRFEKDPNHPIENQNSATYILQQQEQGLRIVFQLDHQDLMKKVQELGLLKA